MKSFGWKRTVAAAAALVALAAAGAASAQYVWLSEQGTRQYSDTPPPASVPPSRILKTPGKAASAAGQALQTAPPASAEKRPPTLAERNADFQKRRMEQAEQQKKAAEAEQLASARASNCDQARSYSRTLESGARIAQLDKNGERAFLTDARRAQEAAATRRILSQCGS